MADDLRAFWGDVSCWAVAVVFVIGLAVLGVRLKAVQVDGVADSKYDMRRQSLRRVQVAGGRGRILARDGTVLADNRPTLAVTVNASWYQERNWDRTAEEIERALETASRIIGRPPETDGEAVRRHLRRSLSRPLVAWRNISEAELARFSEHERQLPGFACEPGEIRVYPQGRFAAQLLGYVGRDLIPAAEDERFSFRDFEMRGRAGLESCYDGYLRGVPGERDLQVDSRGFTHREWSVVEPKRGPDLRLTLDAAVQAEAERQLADVRGACVVLDPRDGAVLAFASSPTYDPNDMVPVLTQERYRETLACPNLASSGRFAPGSIFKPIVALAAMSAGVSPDVTYDCTGAFELGKMRVRCARAWGHGEIGIAEALRESCNAFFCTVGMEAGSNAVITAARAFGLGAKTGIDFPEDPGLVPDDQEKRSRRGERWYPGDLAQMSIGQGMLVVTPLQMARVIGALETGELVTPRLNADLPVERRPVEGFSSAGFAVVREGLRMVVDGGTGRRGGEGVAADVSGKTGTAEVGAGANRYKNTWFVAYARPNASSRPDAAGREVAVAMVVDHGESGGGTTAPRVAEILKAIYNRHD